MLFIKMPLKLRQKLLTLTQAKVDANDVIRLVTSFDTTEQQIDHFLRELTAL